MRFEFVVCGEESYSERRRAYKYTVYELQKAFLMNNDLAVTLHCQLTLHCVPLGASNDL